MVQRLLFVEEGITDVFSLTDNRLKILFKSRFSKRGGKTGDILLKELRKLKILSMATSY
jgi:hypothetical protein